MIDHHTAPLTSQILSDATEWLAYGIARGWCSDTFCGTHDYLDALTPDEITDLDDLDDPCITVTRLL